MSLKDKCSLARELGASIEKEFYQETKTNIDKKNVMPNLKQVRVTLIRILKTKIKF